MNAKLVIPMSLLCGLIGGMVGQRVIPNNPKSVTFETVRVTKDLFVAPDSTSEKGCRASSDGTLTATGGLIANQVRGNLVVGRSLVASLNATQQSLENQQIAVEITANTDRGGELILRNRDGLFCPAKGPATQGYETVIGFDKNGNAPSIYTQNIAQGSQGRAFVVCVKPKLPSPQPETASQANLPAPQQSPRQ